MAILPVRSIKSDIFSYVNETKTFCAEISTIQGNFPSFAIFQQIYDDACDVGFAMVSANTGTVVRFYHASTDLDNEGDIMGWRFKPISEDVRRVSKLDGVSVLIIND
jgi:hypothetical protein